MFPGASLGYKNWQLITKNYVVENMHIIMFL